jgi:hypothetical protein
LKRSCVRVRSPIAPSAALPNSTNSCRCSRPHRLKRLGHPCRRWPDLAAAVATLTVRGPVPCIERHRVLLPVLAALLGLTGVATSAEPVSGDRLSLDCAVVYVPERRTWHRQVDLAFEGGQVQDVQIDQQAPYAFQVLDSVILTAIDNERIQIDIQSLTWSSDFRGLAQGQGRCEVIQISPQMTRTAPLQRGKSSGS